MKESNKNNYQWICNLLISVGIILVAGAVFIGVVRLAGFQNLDANDMMVSFVGILATFVVINNFAQVKEIKDECLSAIREKNETIEAIELMLKQSKQYEAAKYLLDNLNNGEVWTINGLVKKSDIGYSQENVEIKNVSLKGDKFEFTFIKDGKEYNNPWEELSYMYVFESWDNNYCDLRDPLFKFILRRMLKQRSL